MYRLRELVRSLRGAGEEDPDKAGTEEEKRPGEEGDERGIDTGKRECRVKEYFFGILLVRDDNGCALASLRLVATIRPFGNSHGRVSFTCFRNLLG
jgi:hypothetical protein